MKIISGIEYKKDTREELLPDFEQDFPYIASRSEFDKHPAMQVPWHWHKEMELFYMQKGAIDYFTPSGRRTFSAGTGGMVNSNILHMTKQMSGAEDAVQLIHIFDTSLIGGRYGSLMERKYVLPIISSTELEIIPLDPNDKKQAEILEMLSESFKLSTDSFGYEIRLRSALSEIWCAMLKIAEPLCRQSGQRSKADEKVKCMMEYIHENFEEKLSISQVAAAAFVSERDCYRIFGQTLRMTPAEYIKNYRLQMAGKMLAETEVSLAEIGHACGFGTSSYFGKVFKESMGCSPREYRKRRMAGY